MMEYTCKCCQEIIETDNEDEAILGICPFCADKEWEDLFDYDNWVNE